jgi:hypothetical protein
MLNHIIFLELKNKITLKNYCIKSGERASLSIYLSRYTNYEISNIT